uniref:Uncharacterized protein n=1 Tax=Cannabis sativa TaxID=3483 RepID=A0A803PLA5_CANSA
MALEASSGCHFNTSKVLELEDEVLLLCHFPMLESQEQESLQAFSSRYNFLEFDKAINSIPKLMQSVDWFQSKVRPQKTHLLEPSC